jgi:hypothetical protein
MEGRRGAVRLARHRRVRRHAVAGRAPDPGRVAANAPKCAPGRPSPTASSTPACRPARADLDGRSEAQRSPPGSSARCTGRHALTRISPRPGREALCRRHPLFARPTSRSAARWAISISASPTSTGAPRTRTWRVWPTSSLGGRASSTRCPRVAARAPQRGGTRPLQWRHSRRRPLGRQQRAAAHVPAQFAVDVADAPAERFT